LHTKISRGEELTYEDLKMDNSENSEEKQEHTEIKKELQTLADQDDDGSGKVSNVIIKARRNLISKYTFRP
jgi:hypothetical protein